MKIKAVFSLFASVLLLAACSRPVANPASNSGVSSTPSSATTSSTSVSAKSYNPCDLLLASDVAEAFPGSTPKQEKDGTEANAIGQKICFYNASETDQKYVQLSMISAADAPAGLDSVTSMFATTKQALEASQVQDVSGLSDEAYYGGSGLHIGSGLHVLDSAHGVSLSVDVALGFGNNDQAAHLAMEKSIAQKILSRL